MAAKIQYGRQDVRHIFVFFSYCTQTSYYLYIVTLFFITNIHKINAKHNLVHLIVKATILFNLMHLKYKNNDIFPLKMLFFKCFVIRFRENNTSAHITSLFL